MNKKVKMKYMIIIIVILSMVLGGFTIWKIDNKKRKSKDPRECVERKLDIELGEGVVLVEGEAYDDEVGEEEHVNAKFKIEEKELQRIKQDLEKMGSEISEISRKSDIWEDLEGKNIENYYSCFAEGEKAKTVIVNIYIATDSEGKYYLYIFY